jgi:hypothetical protein
MDLTKDDIATEDLLGMQCMELAINHIFKALLGSWDKFLSKCDEHVSILVSHSISHINRGFSSLLGFIPLNESNNPTGRENI